MEKDDQDTPTHLNSSLLCFGLHMHQHLCQISMHNTPLAAISQNVLAGCITVEVGKTLPRVDGIEGDQDRKQAMLSYLSVATLGLFPRRVTWINKLVTSLGLILND